MRSFFTQLNIRQLLIYFIASLLFIYAVRTLSSLYDFQFLYKEFAAQDRLIFKQRFNDDMFIIHTLGFLGLIIAYIISWQISVKKNWFWANSVIVFLLAFGLYFFNLFNWVVLVKILLFAGNLFPHESLASVIINFLVLFAVGCYLFFNKKVISYIDRGVKREEKPGSLKMANAGNAKKK